MQADNAPNARCLRCGSPFECGASTGTCWCQEADTLESIDAARPDCYCPVCLKILLVEQLKEQSPNPPDR